MSPQLIGDELGGLGPTGVTLDRGADARDERAQTGWAELRRGHVSRVGHHGSYVQCQLSY